LLGRLLEGRLQWLLLGLGSLLELEGGVWLLRLLGDKGGGWLAEGWGSLLGGEKLGVGGVSWVEEWVDSLTVSTGGHGGGAGDGVLLLLALDWSLLELLSLDWSLLELLSLDWSLLDLLSWGWSGSELGSIHVGLEIQMSWIGGVDEGIEVACWSLWLRLGHKLLLLSLLSRSHRSHRPWLGSDGSSLRLLNLTTSNLWVKRSALKSIGSLWDVISLQDPEAVLSSGVPHSDGLAVLVNVAVLSNPLPVSSGLLPEHCPVLLGEGRTKPAVSSVKSLLFQNFCILRI